MRVPHLGISAARHVQIRLPGLGRGSARFPLITVAGAANSGREVRLPRTDSLLFSLARAVRAFRSGVPAPFRLRTHALYEREKQGSLFVAGWHSFLLLQVAFQMTQNLVVVALVHLPACFKNSFQFIVLAARCRIMRFFHRQQIPGQHIIHIGQIFVDMTSGGAL